eukprot:CAMPEP_0204005528 /NCGR_PEP_ID=MMETSP0360-20130528/19154_1 /ASSEMBLY_ACC=CAM_ASM_000342 /TAXON_ID=268821 /ORGANISM="Scrippsiella Hangoei, Strain SHTV-5" /LENGTH=47 /DNA_ID= /DNA_START= /DNA_END= /DNA_ORIENTATION=
MVHPVNGMACPPLELKEIVTPTPAQSTASLASGKDGVAAPPSAAAVS